MRTRRLLEFHTHTGVDEYFHEEFRALLRQVYVALGDEVPQFLSVQ